jgi:hypothetical protein
MNTQGPRRIDRETAERMLCGDPITARDSRWPLASLLVAAAAPALPAELASEQACVDRFRAASRIPARRPRRLSVIKATVLRLLTVKAAIAALATTAAGGVAFAASTGTLHNPLGGHASGVAPGVTASQPVAKHAKPSEGTGDRGADGQGRNGGPAASHAPSPSLVRLCHAYDEGNKAEHGKALDNPAFTVLITAAGGRDRVDAYCSALLASESGPTPTGRPENTEPGNDHAPGKPTSRPSH